MRARAWWLCFCLCACREERAPSASTFALTAVVASAVAELEGRLPAPEAPPQADAELSERTFGLLDMLAGAEPRLHEVALEDARSLGDGAVGLAAAALADAQASVARRRAAAELLGALGTRAAAEVLCTHLEKGLEPWLRAQCAFQLEKCGVDAVLPRMLVRLKAEKDGETVVWLSVACARLGSYGGLDGLRVLRASGASEELRALAATRLEELAQEAGLESGEELYTRWNSPRASELALPAPSDALRLEVWRRVAGLKDWNLRTVDDCRFALSHSAPWVTETLARALHDEDVYVRVHAAQCLERMGPRGADAGAELIAALGEPRLAAAAAAALGGLEHAPAASELARLLENAPEFELRIAAAQALGHLGAAAPRAALRAVLARTPPEPLDLRQAAAQALLALEEVEAVPFVLACLGDPAADAGAAEAALDAWLARRAGEDERCAAILERWRALAKSAEAIPTAAELAARQRARVELLRDELDGL